MEITGTPTDMSVPCAPDLTTNQSRRQILTVSALKNQDQALAESGLKPRSNSRAQDPPCLGAPADAGQSSHSGLPGCLPSIPHPPRLHHRTSSHYCHLAPSLAPSVPSARSPASQRPLSSSSRALSGLTQGGMNLQVPATHSPAPAITASQLRPVGISLKDPGFQAQGYFLSPHHHTPLSNWLSLQLSSESTLPASGNRGSSVTLAKAPSSLACLTAPKHKHLKG